LKRRLHRLSIATVPTAGDGAAADEGHKLKV
jgi:hypothetical protein